MSAPFRVPTHLYLAPGSFAELPAVAHSFQSKRILLATDAGVANTPWPERASRALRERGVEVRVFERIEANPRASTLEAMAEMAREESVDAVLGLGGGSVLDAAKAAAMLATNGGRCESYEGRNRFSRPALPFIAMPTTCGTGSEVTWVSVISVPERKAKISVKGDGMFPRVALVDPDLLTTLPASLVAWTGLDALTHALEATTGRLANPASDALAERAIELLCRFLRRAVADIAGDREAREAVMTASTLAGLAFGNADVAAVHCLSETLGGLYDVPHGLANAVLLVPVMRSHGQATAARLASLERAVTGEVKAAGEGAERALEALELLIKDLETPAFSALQVPEADFADIARRSVSNGSNGSNPRAMGVDDYLSILAQLTGSTQRAPAVPETSG